MKKCLFHKNIYKVSYSFYKNIYYAFIRNTSLPDFILSNSRAQ